MDKEEKGEKEEKGITLKDFFESIPPGKKVRLAERAQLDLQQPYFNAPIIELHCTSQTCDGSRFWRSDEKIWPESRGIVQEFITYVCRNCSSTKKEYAIQVWKTIPGPFSIIKFGEVPAFGPPIASRLITLIGDNREYFLMGRRAENQGMGIGAFAYYRRVIENQKNRIFQAVIDVAKKLPESDELIKQLEAAKQQTQFSKAVEQVKAGLPQVLLIDSHHNPLTLLHAALSDGIHDKSDEECLERATDIRMVMTELAERISIALKNVVGLSQSVSRLMNSKVKNKVEAPAKNTDPSE